MPTYGSYGSPSLNKMENGYGHGGRTSFSLGRIFGDPFALATISIGSLAWIIAFVSSILSAVRPDPKERVPPFAWWTLVYMLFSIVGVAVTVASDSERTYHVAIVGFTAAGIVLSSSAVNALVYSPVAANEAAAAGFILLSMIAIVWVFYYGSQPQASHRTFVDSYALHKEHPASRSSRQMSNNYGAPQQSSLAPNQPQLYTSAQLNGFETSSPVSGYPGGPVGADARGSSIPRFGGGMGQTPTNDVDQPQQEQSVEYPYRAKAIYSYEANPDDANEISFQKHDILEVSDVSGRWWQAKKPNGETGIAPSNYLILL
ncbi:Transmembrane osmosensor [Didymosphaeria variabile]|uniref:Transmembrane osmosensor n=1 Tax=Didymosphaeria variabile TaxID=1932322 RepID=A0A9W8XJS7_9PLEO|nr:Transmembrane osmosensor [Didymosphaeria variabile]KAJ4351931.1 Transmembrane osmosensor [Didymosphaeria variabile]